MSLHEIDAPAALLEARDIERRFSLPRHRPWQRAERFTALKGVSLCLAPGERVGLLGSSGSGKSTLLRTLLALEAADRGEVRCQGRRLTPASARALRWYRRLVQYVPQDPAASLDPRMSVEALIREPLARLGILGNHREMVREALVQVELPLALLDRRPALLSGGQAQRVAIARAIATRPRLLLADEPVSGLDLPLRMQVVELLERLSNARGMGLLLVSHDLAVVARLCSRTLVMAAGEIVEARPTAALLQRPQHPATQALIQALPRLPNPPYVAGFTNFCQPLEARPHGWRRLRPAPPTPR